VLPRQDRPSPPQVVEDVFTRSTVTQRLASPAGAQLVQRPGDQRWKGKESLRNRAGLLFTLVVVGGADRGFGAGDGPQVPLVAVKTGVVFVLAVARFRCAHVASYAHALKRLISTRRLGKIY
jgi:hypothetical protein